MWLRFYEWVTSGDGPQPPDEVLNDDEALDAFVDKWKEDLKNPSKKPKEGHKTFVVE